MPSNMTNSSTSARRVLTHSVWESGEEGLRHTVIGHDGPQNDSQALLPRPGLVVDDLFDLDPRLMIHHRPTSTTSALLRLTYILLVLSLTRTWPPPHCDGANLNNQRSLGGLVLYSPSFSPLLALPSFASPPVLHSLEPCGRHAFMTLTTFIAVQTRRNTI